MSKEIPVTETEETDIALEAIRLEKAEQRRKKQEEQTLAMLATELDGYGYPPDGECYRYDLGGDEWIDSLTGADTWYRQNMMGNSCGCGGRTRPNRSCGSGAD